MRPSITSLMLAGAALLAACSLVGSSVDHFSEGSGKSNDGGSCPGGQERCGATCVDLQSSPLHCGACGEACPEGQVCSEGSCTDSCPAGKEECARACVDLQIDPNNCGKCSVSCGADGVCSGGICSASCGPRETECSGSCVDVETDDQNCGGCGKACAVGQACSGGSCVASCTTGQMLCGDLCVDTTSNVKHCGGCDKPCDTGDVCKDGKCELFCPAGQTECGGLCIDLMNNNKNCGMCGKACQAGEVCGNGTCAVSCPPGRVACAGSCVDTSSDDAHCGGCDQPCAKDYECRAGKCEISCQSGLNTPITDPWGQSWDGLERPAGSLGKAIATCLGIGGRLPTATELYRVSATQSGTVGQTFHTNYLWSLVPYDPTRQQILRLSDGATSNQAVTSPLTYRCTCPVDDTRSTFDGAACNGPPGDECTTLSAEGGRYRLDRRDRAPLTKGGAIWECAFHRAHLARFGAYVEAILEGAEGSETWLHTADDSTYQWDTLVKWSGTPGATWVASGNVSYGAMQDIRPFRCAGAVQNVGTHPNPVGDGYVASDWGYEGEAHDSPAGLTYAEQIDACFDRGGHLPSMAELAELVQLGLPNGTGAWLMTSDNVGFQTSAFLMGVLRWTAIEPRFAYWYDTFTTWAWKTNNTEGYRCVYYPIDTSYVGPGAGQCQGSCTELTLAGATPARMWLDDFDRVPATYAEAFETCRAANGHLAGERDLAEAVRRGLPNGSATWVFTSDVGVGGGTTPNAITVQWTGTDTAFTSQYSAYQTWHALTESHPYRCVWSNELR